LTAIADVGENRTALRRPLYGETDDLRLYAAAPIAFALFWLALVAFFGVRLAERRPMNHIRNAPPSTPIAE
jgi:uncharacterized membrane protein YcfT